MVPGSDDNDTSCYEVHTAKEGSLTSQNYPGEYPANSSCMYIIRQPPGATITLKLRYMQIEQERNEETGTCHFDFLEVSISSIKIDVSRTPLGQNQGYTNLDCLAKK